MASDTMVTLSSLISDLRTKAKEQADDVITQYINNKQLERKVKNLWTNTNPNNDTGSSYIKFTIPNSIFDNEEVLEYITSHLRSLGYDCMPTSDDNYEETGVRASWLDIEIPFSELDPN